MLKNILKLDGAQKLNKNEQKSINGGTWADCVKPALSLDIYDVTHVVCPVGYTLSSNQLRCCR